MEWNYYDLIHATAYMRTEKAFLKECEAKQIQHAIDFIEYNMREMEITGGNGD